MGVQDGADSCSNSHTFKLHSVVSINFVGYTLSNGELVLFINTIV